MNNMARAANAQWLEQEFAKRLPTVLAGYVAEFDDAGFGCFLLGRRLFFIILIVPPGYLFGRQLSGFLFMRRMAGNAAN